MQSLLVLNKESRGGGAKSEFSHQRWEICYSGFASMSYEGLGLYPRAHHQIFSHIISLPTKNTLAKA
jgi:hypothetical protein